MHPKRDGIARRWVQRRPIETTMLTRWSNRWDFPFLLRRLGALHPAGRKQAPAVSTDLRPALLLRSRPVPTISRTEVGETCCPIGCMINYQPLFAGRRSNARQATTRSITAALSSVLPRTHSAPPCAAATLTSKLDENQFGLGHGGRDVRGRYRAAACQVQNVLRCLSSA